MESEQVFTLAKEIMGDINDYIKNKWKNAPAIAVMHALAILYLTRYRTIMDIGSEDEVTLAKLSLKTLSEMAVEEDIE